MHAEQLKDRKRSTDLMFCLSEAIDQFAMASGVRWYGNGVDEGGRSCVEDGGR